MPLFVGFSSGLKTLLLTALSVLSSLRLSNADKSFAGRILVFVGAVLIVVASLEAREGEEKSTMNQMQILDDQIAILSKQMAELKKKYR